MFKFLKPNREEDATVGQNRLKLNYHIKGLSLRLLLGEISNVPLGVKVAVRREIIRFLTGSISQINI